MNKRYYVSVLVLTPADLCMSGRAIVQDFRNTNAMFTVEMGKITMLTCECSRH